MNHTSLTIRYRPQCFSEVVGQDTIKIILSRAAAEDKVAPAYLLSGTRGVGKTTIARIFAKALNCQKAPIGEPCNECDQCKRITKGIHVDVMEIDGASNRGIDDARRLRESIAYAPMEGRYKVFIIDEAHMLTRESFNALLKTLEEPPPCSTFIFATTEAHKFPITIVSRCQHFVFTMLSEETVLQHMITLLKKEQIIYEDTAVRLIARRASGSIRDSISLLGQILTFTHGELTDEIVRKVLGVANREFYEKLLNAFKKQDYLEVVSLGQTLLATGIDLGFFLREFASLWRNLFLFRQVGESAAQSLGLLQDESQRLIALANLFEPIYIHAAWQMVLENQRQILMSFEPAVSLELLFLNLTLLPQIVSLEQISKIVSFPSSIEPKQELVQQSNVVETVPSISKHTEVTNLSSSSTNTSFPVKNNRLELIKNEEVLGNIPEKLEKSPVSPLLSPPSPPTITTTTTTTTTSSSNHPSSGSEENFEEPTWEGFLTYCNTTVPDITTCFLNKFSGTFQNDDLILSTDSHFLYNKFMSDKFEKIQELVQAYIGKDCSIQLIEPKNTFKSESELKKDIVSHPVVQALEQTFDAELLRCTPIKEFHKNNLPN